MPVPWNSGTYYKVGDQVVASDNKTYQAISANTNKDPTSNAAIWYVVSPLPVGLYQPTAAPTASGSVYVFPALTITGLTTTSIISAMVQSGTTSDCFNAWLVSAVPTANALTFNVGAIPTTLSPTANPYTISYAVVRF